MDTHYDGNHIVIHIYSHIINDWESLWGCVAVFKREWRANLTYVVFIQCLLHAEIPTKLIWCMWNKSYTFKQNLLLQVQKNAYILQKLLMLSMGTDMKLI